MDKFYEMRCKSDEFTPLRFDRNYRIEIIDKYDIYFQNNFISIINSINTQLPMWDDKPTLECIEKRLNSISKCIFFFHKNFKEPIGWGWYSDVFTYDFINEVHPLPTTNSIYFGGTYITKDKENLPRNAGFQLYNYDYNFFMNMYEYMYGYMNGWNFAPIRICEKLGTKQVNFIDHSL